MKSSLGITHRANLCTIAEIYRPSVIFLLLIVWVCQSVVHSLIYTVSSGRSWMRLCVTVVQSHSRSLKLVPIGEARMQITIIVHYFDAMPIFYRFRDITIYWSKICIFCPFYSPQSRLKPPQGSFPWDLGYESWYQKNYRSMGCAMVNTTWAYGH